MRAGPGPEGREIRTVADAMARAEALAGPHMTALERYRAALERRFGATPHADPADGGDAAELLILLETPGPRGPAPRFVSWDNAAGTARNLRAFLREAGLDRRRVVLWNAVPWIIHTTGALNRAPRRSEITAGLAELHGFLEMLPRLRAAVTAGQVAGLAAPTLARARPGLPVLAMPHPSPTYVCTSPAVGARIRDVLRSAAALLDAGEARPPP